MQTSAYAGPSSLSCEDRTQDITLQQGKVCRKDSLWVIFATTQPATFSVLPFEGVPSSTRESSDFYFLVLFCWAPVLHLDDARTTNRSLQLHTVLYRKLCLFASRNQNCFQLRLNQDQLITIRTNCDELILEAKLLERAVQSRSYPNQGFQTLPPRGVIPWVQASFRGSKL